MIDPAQIPGEVVEAAALAYRTAPLKRTHLQAMELAIAAALSAWPGMTHMEPDLANGIIILPLPQQASDE
jgi:hypothetical protein